jgi:hypothetical protein
MHTDSGEDVQDAASRVGWAIREKNGENLYGAMYVVTVSQKY